MSPGRRRTYLTLIILGAVAFLVDRFLLPRPGGEPNPATAETSAKSMTPLASADQSAAGRAAPLIPEIPFPRGLERLEMDLLTKDFFAPPTAEQSDPPAAAADNRPGTTGDDRKPDRLDRATFADRRRLEGIVIHGRLKTAIVDGLWLQIGQSLDGCTLFSLSGNEAQFECYDGPVVLHVRTPSLRARN